MGKTVLIVGSGVGGLATAVRLLARGFDVKVFEKESSIGGKTNQVEHNSFTFDLTASILMNREKYQEVFTDADLDYRDYLQFTAVEPTYRCFYPDGVNYDFSRDLTKLIRTLEAVSKQDAIGYMELFATVYQRYIVADEHFLQKSFETPGDFFKPSSLANAFKTKALSTSAQLIAKHVKDEKLRKFLIYQALYVGISPFEGPSTYVFVPVVAQLYGLWHPKGGIYSYIKALAAAIHDLGGEIAIDCPVEEILISGGKAVGIKTNGEDVRGDIVVSNADFPYTMESLIKGDEYKGKYSTKKIQTMKYTCSVFILHLGLKKRLSQLSVHNLYLNHGFKKNIEAAFTGDLPVEPSFYMYCPTRVDSSMSPEDGECFSVIVRVPNLLAKNIEWNEDTIRTLRNRTISSLKQISGLQDIEENIVFESYVTPQDLLNRFNSYAGAAFGLSPTLTQANYFRPHLKSDTVDNLYFVGQSVHPGPGVSLVLLSAKLVAENILHDMQ